MSFTLFRQKSPPPLTVTDLDSFKKRVEPPLSTLEHLCNRTPSAQNTAALATLKRLNSVFHKVIEPAAEEKNVSTQVNNP